MAQNESFFSPVIQALAEREQILARKQQAEIQQKKLEQEQQRIDLYEKNNERLLKQQEASQKAQNLEMGVKLKLLADQKRAQLTGTPTAPASQSIPGAGQIQQQPLLENILQQRGLVNSLPQSDVIVRGQENAPVNLDIPDPFTGQSQVKVPIGTTSELIRERATNEATRRAEEQRKLQLVGQQEALKTRAQESAKFPFQQALAESKNKAALTLEGERQKNREALANIRGRFQIQAAKERGAGVASDLGNLALQIGLGLQSQTGAVKDRAAVTNILASKGWVPPPKDLDKSIDALSDVPILLGQTDNLIEKLGDSSNPKLVQVGRQAQQFFTGSNEIINQAKSLEAFATPIMRQMGEKGMFSNKDIERGMSLLPDPSIPQKDNLRRRELLNSMFEIGINNKVRSLPESQKRAIFEQYDIPFRVLSQDQIANRYKEIDKFISGNAEAAPSGKPVVSGNGKIVEFDGRKYPAGQTFPIGNKTYRWKINGDTAIPVEVQ